MTGKPEDQVRAGLAEAIARPEAVRNAGLRAGVERLQALTAARQEVSGAIAEGRVRAAAPVLSLDPHTSPVSWRVEVRKAGQAAGDHAPMPDPAADRAVFDGRTVPVADALALLRARREALGVPSGVPAKPGTAAAVLDLAAGTLREAVVEGRLSARSRIAAVPPSDRKEWRTALRDAVAADAKRSGAGRGRATAQGREASERAYQRERQASLEAQSLRARDAHAPAAERAAEAMRQAEAAQRTVEQQQVQRAQQERQTPRQSRGMCKTGPCANCSHWRDPSSDMLAGTAAQEGQCRRRVQTGEDGLRPRQPLTGPGVECSEQLPLPAPERLAACCGDCRYWKAPDVARVAEGEEGFCRVWAPRWSAKRGYSFPITTHDFQCGDGVSASYVDPEDEEIE